ncbi:hypothetical protein NI454_08410 [Brevundimonas diminuta]|uniref:Uncharacterized protein n=1 Tax=Brevundimonas naejangsanensis TaxID=588932 RepID=A0A172Y475_9CAUL|nr:MULTISPECIES: hypothetical protein [Brevundimonas]ANF54010.1 hypothetical protein DA69_04160 [Brevundimonas naejangsanensis]MCO8029976.1 hypothetical protein [Brevundimonas diminuta]
MSAREQTIRTQELPALPGKLGEIEALLQAARSLGGTSGEQAVLDEISRIIARSSGDIYQKPLG